VRETHSAKGKGLFARADIVNNRWLGEYTGEVLTQEEYLAKYPNEDAQYVLGANTDYNIDAADAANSSFLRYANHSSDPNCFYEVERVRRQRQKRVMFYTARDVKRGEELTFDYGASYWAGRADGPI